MEADYGLARFSMMRPYRPEKIATTIKNGMRDALNNRGGLYCIKVKACYINSLIIYIYIIHYNVTIIIWRYFNQSIYIYIVQQIFAFLWRSCGIMKSSKLSPIFQGLLGCFFQARFLASLCALSILWGVVTSDRQWFFEKTDAKKWLNDEGKQ